MTDLSHPDMSGIYEPEPDKVGNDGVSLSIKLSVCE